MNTRIYEPVGSAFVRMPQLPFECWKEKTTPQTEQAIAAAIAVSSPSLSKNLNKETQSASLMSRLNRFRTRMSTRATPYGLFAGVGIIQFGDKTDLRRDQTIRTRTRPDMSWLACLIEKFESTKEVRRQLRYFCNPENLALGQRLWNDRIHHLKDKQFKIASVKATAPVLAALSHAQFGLPFEVMVQRLADSFGVTNEKSEQLCNQLCEANLIQSELRRSLSTENPVLKIMECLSTITGHGDFRNQLDKLAVLLNDWDCDTEKSIAKYFQMQELAEQIVPGQPNVFQTDMVLDLRGRTVSKKIAQTMGLAVELCLRLAPRVEHLVAYKNQFEWRYQIGREVPILELLSSRIGLGSPYTSTSTSLLAHNNDVKRDELLQAIALESIKTGNLCVDLSETQLQVLERWKPDIRTAPRSVDLIASVSAQSRSDIDNGDFRIVLGTRGGDIGAGRTLGRFADMLGDEAESILRYIADNERKSESNTVFADLNCWPTNARYANVAIAPNYREYSIVARCSGEGHSRSIPLNEIAIGIHNRRFYAKWLKTGQLISAQSNNLLNDAYLAEPLRFLSDIALDGLPFPSPFSWGPVSNFPFLPRITVGKIVLRPAQWRVQDLADICRQIRHVNDFRRELENWRLKWKVPTWVQISNTEFDDNLLLLDLSAEDDVNQLFEMIKKNASLFLREFISSANWNSSEDGHFVSEVAVSFLRSDLAHIPEKPPQPSTAMSKLFSYDEFLKTPGSSWLYLRIDANEACHEEIIVAANKLASQMKSNEQIENWFFVRYVDSQAHLRLRFRVDEQRIFSQTLPMLCSWANEQVRNKLCCSFSFHTYDQEIERYGGPAGLKLSEQLFGVDSHFVAQILSLPNITSLDRNIVAILSINCLLSAFGMTFETRLKWLRTFMDDSSKRAVSSEYRVQKKLLCSLLLGRDVAETRPYESVRLILDEMKTEVAPIARQLQECSEGENLSGDIQFICESFVHMHCNRLLGIDRLRENRVRALLMNTLESITKMSN